MITDEEKTYMRENHKTKTVLEMAEHLKRRSRVVYNYLRNNKLEVFKQSIPISEAHPFREKNKKLERSITHNRIVNRNLSEGRIVDGRRQ